MAKSYYLIANWKMYLGLNEALEFAQKNEASLIELALKRNVKLAICPQAISIFPMMKIFQDTPIEIGGQNCSSFLQGSFTGHTSARCLYEAGCKFCIIGHSERRKHNKETTEEIIQKFIHLIDYDITPILCIGETQEQYKAKQTTKVLESQLEGVIESLKSLHVRGSITPLLAYEPIWAIGTDMVPDRNHLESSFAFLDKLLKKGRSGLEWKLLYGGSVSEKNIESLKAIDFVDGFLVGRASCQYDQLKGMLEKLR